MPQTLDAALALLEKYFGYNSFQGDQERVITRLLESDENHSLVIMPTGGGKSLCYQIPALCFEGKTIVLSPLVSLMKDQVDGLRSRKIKASYINATVSREDREKRLESFVYGDTKILYITPERFKNEEFRNSIKRADISLLAVDEAHCISAWGNDFRPDYSLIGEYRKLLGNPLTIALTATATPRVQEDIIRALDLDSDDVEIFHQGIRRPNLILEAEEVMDDDTKLEKMVRIVAKNPGSGIIYFSLIKTLETFSAALDGLGVKHYVYHGKLDQRERKSVQNAFMEGNELVLATNAFGMGIDKADIRYIVHAEIPGSVEAYYQEIGRAGRDGKKAMCSLIYNQEDLMIHMDFIHWSNPEPSFYKKLHALLSSDMDKFNAFGQDYLKEQLVYKNRFDFRLETALGMLERFSVISGSTRQKNLKLLGDLPEVLVDEKLHEEKIMHARTQLLAMVNYFRSEDCRFSYLEEYFGMEPSGSCGICDNC